MIDIETLKYPIGQFVVPASINKEQLNKWIDDLEKLPEQIESATANLSDEQLDTPYRPDGWTLRQVIHHLPDSHMNAYIRFKLAITEKNPVIRPYQEDLWAQCEEARSGSINVSVSLLRSLHVRWAAFLKTLTGEEFNRTYLHPEHNRTFILKDVLAMYVWHGKHHLAHITETIKRNNW